MKTFLIGSLTLLVALMSSNGAWPAEAAAQKDLPYTFFSTHYELLGDPNDPDRVRYHSTGKPSAKVPDGSKVTLSGKGGWDPTSKTAQGGGRYTIKDALGAVTARGSWQVNGFGSFEQFDGWWGWDRSSKRKAGRDPPDRLPFRQPQAASDSCRRARD